MEFIIEYIDIYVLDIVFGYIIISIFNYVTLKEKSEEGISSNIILSFIIGYIYIKIFNIIPIHISNEIDTLIMLIFSIILSYVSGMIYASNNILRNMLDRLHVKQTPNKYIWNDLLGEYPIQATIKYDKSIYEGFVYLIEGFSNSPHIILASYIEYDLEGNEILNNSESNDKIIILDLSNSLSVEVKYFKEDKICKSIQKSCDSRKIMYRDMQDQE